MKSSFSKRDKRQSKNRGCNLLCRSQIWRSCFGKEFDINMYIYTWICEKLFSENTIYEFDIGFASPFFWKRHLSQSAKEYFICSDEVIYVIYVLCKYKGVEPAIIIVIIDIAYTTQAFMCEPV